MVSKPDERHPAEHDEGDDSEDSDASSLEQAEYDPAQCLFCNQSHSTLDDNVIHMQKMHGLFIPEPSRLLVEVETLINYCYLVISGYYECLYCGTQRSSAEAVQQHMMAKGHCKIDISREESEFRDFYDFTSDHGDGSGGEEADGREPKTVAFTSLVQPTDRSLRLPSGKILSHRSAPKPPPQRRTGHPEHETEGRPEPGLEGPQPPLSQPIPDIGVRSGASTALTRAEKRDLSFASQLARLRPSDRSSLLHLPTSQQRALLATQKKQIESARKAERQMQSRVERMGNKTLMKHFVPDTPGRTNG
jgi:pre-60S factor REI1